MSYGDTIRWRGAVHDAARTAYPDDDYEADYGATAFCQQAFVAGAEWYAAGMAVSAFLDDLAALYLSARMTCEKCGVHVTKDTAGVLTYAIERQRLKNVQCQNCYPPPIFDGVIFDDDEEDT